MELSNNKWIAISSSRPPEDEPVLTMIADENGVRNEQILVRRGNLYYTKDLVMYVYYRPTHWKQS